MCIFAVTPLAGVWIEIKAGIKWVYAWDVTPLAGVWIEIRNNFRACPPRLGHSPCGSVD